MMSNQHILRAAAAVASGRGMLVARGSTSRVFRYVRMVGTATQSPTEPPEPVEDGQRVQRDPRARPAQDLNDPRDLYDTVNPERYYEHAEQVTPDDKPLDYVRLKTREKMADAGAELKQVQHTVGDMAKDAANAIVHPIKTVKETAKAVADRMAPPTNPPTPTEDKQ